MCSLRFRKCWAQGTIILIIMIAVAIKAAKKNPEAAKSAAAGAFSLFKRFIK